MRRLALRVVPTSPLLAKPARRTFRTTRPLAVAATPLNGGRTFFDMFGDAYTAGANAVAAPLKALSPDRAVEAAAAGLEALHCASGVPWPTLLAGTGVACRLALLVFSLRGERAIARLQCALPALGPAHAAFERVYKDPTAKALDVHLAGIALKAERRAVFAQHKTSNLQPLSTLLGAPFVVFGFAVVARCVARSETIAEGAAVGSLAWLSSLTAVDPFCILPILSCLLTMLNVELSLRSQRGAAKPSGSPPNAAAAVPGASADVRDVPARAWAAVRRAALPHAASTSTGTLVWGVRAGAVVGLSVASQLRAATLVYWVGLGLTGLLQPLLLRSAAFRRWFGIPDPPPPIASAAVSSDHRATAFALADEESLLRARLCTALPRLASLMSPAVAQGLQDARKAKAEREAAAGAAARQGKPRAWRTK